jgi:hypothetical protein
MLVVASVTFSLSAGETIAPRLYFLWICLELRDVHWLEVKVEMKSMVTIP